MIESLLAAVAAIGIICGMFLAIAVTVRIIDRWLP